MTSLLSIPKPPQERIRLAFGLFIILALLVQATGAPTWVLSEAGALLANLVTSIILASLAATMTEAFFGRRLAHRAMLLLRLGPVSVPVTLVVLMTLFLQAHVRL